MQSRQSVSRSAVILTACAALWASALHAQEGGTGRGVEGPVGAPRQQTYGTGSPTVNVLQAYDFDPWEGDGANLLGNGFGARGCSSPCILDASADLPSGALIEAMELEACDTNAAATVTATLFRIANLEASFQVLANVSSGATPGCSFFTSTLAPAHTVDNLLNTYLVEVFNNGNSVLTTRLQAVRLIYRLQVSPAPATATFPNDVPTSHPFFRFIEALGRAGISGGCAAGSFCPDAPVTRGQMAVFLSTALGLHFPN